MASLLLLLLAMIPSARAGGPARVAVIDRKVWPRPLTRPADFDAASRLEILAFARRLGEVPRKEAGLKEWLKQAYVNEPSANRWLGEKLQLLAANFTTAASGCDRKELFCTRETTSPEKLASLAKNFHQSLPAEYAAWREASRKFYDDYAYEQLRIAALFPSPTSEALTFSTTELTGDEMGDRKFVLTFDDGPTAAAGETDRLVESLKATGVNGFFFVLVSRLAERVNATSMEKIGALYRGQCVGSHGWEHKSYQKRPDWRQSLDQASSTLSTHLHEGTGSVPLFRPPYGQRTPELTRYLEGKGSRIVLWNIDSQDWNPQVTAEQIPGRMITLMLLWRHGILLFHDVHGKARVAVPEIVKATRAVVTWEDCRKLLP